MSTLQGKVALVTGASRGIGLGIAHELGLAGATVYVTGRSREGEPTTDDLPGTIEAAARTVSEAGGRGISVACDHSDDEAVEALGRRIAGEQGRLDLLVNNVWGGYEQYDAQLFTLPVWEQPLWRWDKMFDVGVRAHYTTSRAVTPLMRQAQSPLIVNISAGDEGKYLGDVQYDVAKAAIDRLAFALAAALKSEGIVALTLYPGFTRTERVLAEAPPEALVGTHSPRFVGRAVVALASDPQLMARTGGAYKVGQLGLDYGFKDIDGSQPQPFVIGEE